MALECSAQGVIQFSRTFCSSATQIFLLKRSTAPFIQDNEITITLSNLHDVPMAFKVLVTSLDVGDQIAFQVY